MRKMVQTADLRRAAARGARYPGSTSGPGPSPYTANLHLSVACLAVDRPPLSQRVEQKFFVTPKNESLAFALLRRTCRADSFHPLGQVNSLYFDTPDLEQHDRSVSGELAKDKIRVRWYGEEYDPHRGRGRALLADGTGESAEEWTTEVWLELKSRRGFVSTKQRLPLEVPVWGLAFPALPRGIVPGSTLARTMAGFGFMARGQLRPVVAISYRRYRFVEPETGFRVSIDSHIRSSLVMPGVGRGERALELPGAVVEVKGPIFELPRALGQIGDIGAAWTRYSKYSSSLEAHEAVSGSVSRLWPSGMMEPEMEQLARLRKLKTTPVTRPEEISVEEWAAERLAPRFIGHYET
jgi:hypothetical protein